MINDIVAVIPALSVIFGLASSILLAVNYLLCAKQCVLFGKIFEVSRIQTGGPRVWCFLCIIIGFLTSFVAVLIVLEKRKHLRRVRFGQVQRTILIGLCTLLMFLNASIISYGFHIWCSSLKYYSCSHHHIKFMDWKMFKPRNSDCSDTWVFLTLAAVFAWSSLITWCFLTITYGIQFAFK